MTHDAPSAATDRIRLLNDQLRQTRLRGRIMLTAGLSALGDAYVARVLAAVASFDDFNADNDPYGEHDCAVVQVGQHKIIWKIDYYDPTMTAGSTDPSDAALTARVLTVMLSEEY